jgi:KS-AT-KR-ACP domain-containing polyene macrolide polyketide synthase/pimaricinolide synthase PimS2/candicidin polyketide synthase FscD
MDAWAQAARARGCPATAVSWGLWAGESMAGDARAQRYFSRRGVRPMDPQKALIALERALLSGRSHVVVADVEWASFRKAFEAWAPRPLLAELDRGREPEEAQRPAASVRRDWAEELGKLSPALRHEAVLDVVRTAVARVLSMTGPQMVSKDRPVKELGLDSLTALELRKQLAALTQLQLPSTLLFDYPTPTAIADLLLERLGLESPRTADDAGISDGALHRTLSSIPPAALRTADFLPDLLRLAREANVNISPQTSTDAAPEIDELGADDLVELFVPANKGKK